MFFRERSKTVTSIDIGTASVKAVSLTRFEDKLSLNNYNEIYSAVYVGKEVGEYAKMGYLEIESILTDCFNQLQVKPDKLVIGVPASECIFRQVRLPINVVETLSKDSESMSNIIKLEFRKVTTGINILNYVFSFTETFRNAYEAEYLVLAIGQDYLNNLNNVAAKLSPSFVLEPNIFGGIRMLAHNYNENAILINIGANNINIAFVNTGKLIGVENISIGINKIIFNVKTSMLLPYSSARDVVLGHDYENNDNLMLADIIKLSTVNIINDIIHVLNNYELRYNIKYSKVYLGGSSVKIINTDIFYSRYLGREVVIIKPFERVSLPVAVQENVIRDSSVFMNAVGLAIEHLEN